MKKIIYLFIVFFLSCGTALAQWDSVGWVEPNIILTSPTTGYYYYNEEGGSPSAPQGMGHLMKSDDGWNTWTEIYSIGSMTPYSAGSIWSLGFINDTVGCMCSSYDGLGGLKQTADGGDSWQSVCGGEPDLPFSWVRADYGYFKGYSNDGLGFYRYDHGQNFRLDTTGYISVDYIYFINDSIGFRLPFGSNGPYYRTFDYGYNWEVTCDSSLSVRKIVFPNSGTGYYVTTTGSLFRTLDMGATWLPVSTVPLSQVNDLFFLDSARGWAVGNLGQILRTTTGGALWETVPSPTSDNILQIKFFSENIGYFISLNTTYADKYILYRTDENPGGIDLPEMPAPVKIFSNPARSTLILNSRLPENEIERMEIVTVYGSTVFVTKRFIREIDISYLSAGIYLLRYSVNGKTWAEKFVVAH